MNGKPSIFAAPSSFSKPLQISSKGMIHYDIYFGKDVIKFISQISKLRLEEFRNFPYLYFGDESYERDYFVGFTRDPQSCLAVAKENNEIVGIATAMPLCSEADILKETEELFQIHGLNPRTFFYFGEFVVLPSFRGRGISTNLENTILQNAKQWGFRNSCLAVVSRDQNDVRKPNNYIASDRVWKKMGYKEINLSIKYSWPTQLESGKIENTINELIFWKKEIL